MVMAALASAEIVNHPSKQRYRWGVRMVESLKKRDPVDYANIGISAVMAVGLIALWVSNSQTNSHDLAQYQGQLKELTTKVEKQGNDTATQISRLADRIDQQPRADQFLQLTQQLAQANGRMGALENEVNTLRTQLAVQAAEMKSIALASEKNLSGRK